MLNTSGVNILKVERDMTMLEVTMAKRREGVTDWDESKLLLESSKRIRKPSKHSEDGLGKGVTEDSEASEVQTPNALPNKATDSNAEMVWASSRKRSGRKKRSTAIKVKPVISPENQQSPDILMTAAIETLVQAASVSRSPGTPQSRLENSSKYKLSKLKLLNGKATASPKPRKRLFADDGLAASGLLALASVTNSVDANGRQAKKSKSGKPPTPKSARKQSRALENGHRGAFAEISGLAPVQMKARRNRRKPEYQSFPVLPSPIVKLHKRLSAMKGVNASSPNAKAVERQIKLQTSLDGLLGWGEKVDIKPGSILSRAQNCLSPAMRKWCYYEWFYSFVDKPWFDCNEFINFLEHAGISKFCRLKRAEWSIIRRALGKPRRLSLSFLHEERAELEAHRSRIRKMFKEIQISEMLKDMPRPLAVGQRVTARHPTTCQIHDGSILTVDYSHNKYRVQFDRQELGVQQLDDIYIMARNGQESVPLPPLRKVHLEPLSISEPTLSTPRHQNTSALSQAEGLVTVPADYYLDSSEIDMRSLAEVDMLLDVKERMLGVLRQMNDEAEGNMHLDEEGRTSEQFQQHYALLVRNLRDCNDKLKAALVRLQQRIQFNQYKLASQMLVQNSAQQVVAPSFVAVPKLTNSDVAHYAKSIIAEARKLAMPRLKGIKQIKTSLLSKRKQNKRLSGQSSNTEIVNRANEEKRLKDLITNCVVFMYALQICADRCLTSEAASATIDMLASNLAPQGESNAALFNEIKASIGVIKSFF